MSHNDAGRSALGAGFTNIAPTLLARRLVKRNDLLGWTGRTGNADTQPLEEAHLHFGIHTTEKPHKWPTGWIDPARLYGVTPVNITYTERFDPNLKVSGLGLRAPGVNVLERE